MQEFLGGCFGCFCFPSVLGDGEQGGGVRGKKGGLQIKDWEGLCGEGKGINLVFRGRSPHQNLVFCGHLRPNLQFFR